MDRKKSGNRYRITRIMVHPSPRTCENDVKEFKNTFQLRQNKALPTPCPPFLPLHPVIVPRGLGYSFSSVRKLIRNCWAVQGEPSSQGVVKHWDPSPPASVPVFPMLTEERGVCVGGVRGRKGEYRFFDFVPLRWPGPPSPAPPNTIFPDIN